jgi:signal transduction histidine kinase
MHRHGSLTLRHLLVAVLVVIVVNGQLTWWIIFVLRENRTRLQFERNSLMARCEGEAEHAASRLRDARSALLGALVAGKRPGTGSPPSPFGGWQFLEGSVCVDGWSMIDRSVTLRLSTTEGCLEATSHSGWAEHAVRVGDDFEIVSAGVSESEAMSADLPEIRLPPPFEDRSVRPRNEAWAEILDGYRRRILMIVSEGAFFAVLLFVLIGLLVRTLRREAELERRHRNFLSAITHELKSPLASMQLALETVLSGRAEGQDRDRFLENAMRDTERLKNLVQKVLEVTRYDRGGGELDMKSANMSDLVENVLADFARRTRPLGVDIEGELAPGVGAELDPEAFAIVISNLLENAMKYGGSNPKIAVRLVVERGHAHLDVSDNGAGIPMEEVPYVFDRFYRGGDEMTRTTDGTGLGLYLVKQIVSAHRGSVAITANGPGGKTFRVTVPARQMREDGP